MECYFANQQEKSQNLILDHDDTKHITKVLRHKLNDQITVIFNQQKYLTKIIKLEPLVVCQIISTVSESNSELPIKVTLIMALLKGEKFDLVIQKAVELGVYQIVPIQLERCISTIDNHDKGNKKLLRWQNIAKAAAKQANRNIIPVIQPLTTNLENVSKFKSDVNYLAYENEKNINSWTKSLDDKKTVTIVIGPEGGISNKELNIFAQLGFNNISLGPTILRAETAPLYFLSVINYYQTFKE